MESLRISFLPSPKGVIDIRDGSGSSYRSLEEADRRERH